MSLLLVPTAGRNLPEKETPSGGSGPLTPPCSRALLHLDSLPQTSWPPAPSVSRETVGDAGAQLGMKVLEKPVFVPKPGGGEQGKEAPRMEEDSVRGQWKS